MNLHTTSFFNSTEVNISSRMNEYLKKNFGYEVEGDFDTLQEARKSLQAEQLELKDNYMSAKYVENMLMIETITSLLKAHGETSPVQEDKYSDMNPTNKFGYFGGPGFYSNDGSTYTEPHYDDFDIRQHNRDNPEDKIKLNNWDDFNLKMRYHKKDGKRVQGYGGMGYNVSFHGNPKDVEAFAMEHLDAERYSGDNIPEAVQMKAVKEKGTGRNTPSDNIRETVKEDDEEKGPDHYRWKNESQLSHAQRLLAVCVEELDSAIEYRSENSDKFFTGFEERAGVGSLMSMKEKLEKVHDGWDESTEFYAM